MDAKIARKLDPLFKRVLFDIIMPGFYKKMPNQKTGGFYVSGSCLNLPEFGFEKYHKKYKVFNNIQDAYRSARYRTYLRHLRTLLILPNWGVSWFVQTIESGDKVIYKNSKNAYDSYSGIVFIENGHIYIKSDTSTLVVNIKNIKNIVVL